jgi:DNA-binding NtrC family response regulator
VTNTEPDPLAGTRKKSAVRYRLRGEVGGQLRSYAVPAGESTIGSVTGSDVVLPVKGVSKRHARLVLGEDGLLLEDLGSRNGTLANGVRIQRSRLQPGDEVRIGPVVLRLEEVEPDDTDLAFVVPRGNAPVIGLPPSDTTSIAVDERGGAGLAIVEGVLVRLSVRPEPDVSGALGRLRTELGARGAVLFEQTGSATVVLVGTGEVPDLTLHRGFHEVARAADGASGGVAAASLPGDPPICCALRTGPALDRLGLAVLGKLRLPPSEAERLLRVLLSLTDLFRPRPLHEDDRPVGAGERGLVFPEGYVPGDSPAMTSLYAQMRPLLQGDLPVLLLGETGVGKEYLAHILHGSSRRHAGPFVAVNCAAIPAELLEAEMFGIGKGVATGVAERVGKFQLAQGGTLFLDEIAEMPLALQSKLLRALQEREVQPVGGAPVAVDIRVVAATNSDLERRMDDNLFRRDLYYRVAGYALRVPPLRQRKEDIPALVEDFARGFARETGKAVRGVTVKALRALVDYAWPGNVRELEHEVRRLVYLCPAGQAIESSMLSEHLVATRRADDPPAAEASASLELEGSVSRLERRLIQEALSRTGGNRTQAARLLAVSRNGLAIKMERLGITD